MFRNRSVVLAFGHGVGANKKGGEKQEGGREASLLGASLAGCLRCPAAVQRFESSM